MTGKAVGSRVDAARGGTRHLTHYIGFGLPVFVYIPIPKNVLTRFLPGAAAPDSNDGTDVAFG